MKLLSTTPSPYARKVRIALAEKGLAFELVDIAIGSTLGYLSLRLPDFDWPAAHPALAGWFARISERPSFAATLPAPQGFRDRVV